MKRKEKAVNNGDWGRKEAWALGKMHGVVE